MQTSSENRRASKINAFDYTAGNGYQAQGRARPAQEQVVRKRLQATGDGKKENDLTPADFRKRKRLPNPIDPAASPLSGGTTYQAASARC
jgi:hypothetical protein